MDRLAHIFNLQANSYRKLVNQRLRWIMLGVYDYDCQLCAGESGEHASHINHIIPMGISRPGAERLAKMDVKLPEKTLDCLDNLVALCKPCSRAKHSHVLDEGAIQSLQESADGHNPWIELVLEMEPYRPNYFLAHASNEFWHGFMFAFTWCNMNALDKIISRYHISRREICRDYFEPALDLLLERYGHRLHPSYLEFADEVRQKIESGAWDARNKVGIEVKKPPTVTV